MPHILIIEDDKRIADLLSRALTENGMDVVVARNIAEAKSSFSEAKPELVISDIMLPNGENGLEFCQELRQTDPDIPIIMLTALGTTDHKVAGFDAGADDYLVKPFEIRELLARVKRLLERRKGNKNQNDILQIADVKLNIKTKTVTRANQDVRLTPREFQLLLFMMNNVNRVISREEIASEVWGVNFDTGTNFIDVYINYLRKKIDKPFDKKLIHTRSGMGFILSETP
jgi:DNA-binding response OmpR family regulator